MTVTIHQGDCLEVLPTLPADSFDSCVTDPPYHLTSIVKRFGKPGSVPAKVGETGAYARASRGFMGQQWDGGDIAFRPETWAAVLRALKPGAHLAAFGGTRTFHRMMVAIEDAGFELRDTLMWVYGTGFPKSHNQHGEWEGWGTAYKPAWEPIAVFRKPLIGTVAENLAQYGTGAINIDGCRVPSEGGRTRTGEESQDRRYTKAGSTNFSALPGPRGGGALGRWPANLLHDGSEDVLAAFPAAPGQQGRAKTDDTKKTNIVYGKFARNDVKHPEPRGDEGSAARFFYCAKASRADREDGCDSLPLPAGGMVSETSGQHITRRDGGAPGLVRNPHPTVKPTPLMQWLCRSVTRPGGRILDPFTGSGSTGRGAVLEGFHFVGIEQAAAYANIAEARIRAVMPVSAEAEALLA